jgi:U3 small nucleolar RNA-associated protein 15
VQVYEAASRALLRTFLGHEAAVRVTRFSPSVKTIVMSGSDDGSVRGWDVAAERQTLLLHGHRDYVRAGAISSVSPDVWLSGSYDHSVAVWDVRTGGGPVQRLEQGAPVEALLVLPSGSALAVAAGPAVRIWDLVGARPRELLQAHQKAVTCLALDASASRLLAGGLDHLVKIYDVKDWSLAHQLRAPGPLLSLAISAENRHLALGLVDGSLVLRSRSAVAAQTGEAARQRSRRAVLHSGSFRYFMRGKAEQPIQADLRLVAKKRAHLRDYDQYLKAFRYAEALDAALASRQVAVFASMVEELRRRHVFRSSLAGRDETALAPLLRFLVQHLSHPRHASLFLDIAETLLGMLPPPLHTLPYPFACPRLTQASRHVRTDHRTVGGNRRVVPGSAEPPEAGNPRAEGARGAPRRPRHAHLRQRPAAASRRDDLVVHCMTFLLRD